MRDGVDFQHQVARFGRSDAAYIVDVLRDVYKVMDTCDRFNNDGMDSEMKLLFGDFIEALDECDAISIVDDEFLVDEN